MVRQFGAARRSIIAEVLRGNWPHWALMKGARWLWSYEIRKHMGINSSWFWFCASLRSVGRVFRTRSRFGNTEAGVDFGYVIRSSRLRRGFFLRFAGRRSLRGLRGCLLRFFLGGFQGRSFSRHQRGFLEHEFAQAWTPGSGARSRRENALKFEDIVSFLRRYDNHLNIVLLLGSSSSSGFFFFGRNPAELAGFVIVPAR